MLIITDTQAQEAVDLATLLSDIHLLNSEEVELAIAETILEREIQVVLIISLRSFRNHICQTM